MSLVVRRFSLSIGKAIRKPTTPPLGPEDNVPTPTSLNGPAQENNSPAGHPPSLTFDDEEDSYMIDEDGFDEPFTKTRRIREVRRSWPQTDQEVEFRYGVTVRGKQVRDDGEFGARVKAMELSFGTEAGYGDNHSSVSTHSEVHTRQVINWEHLPEDKIATLERSNVWNGGSGLFDIEQNEAELARIVSLFTPNKPDKRVSVGKVARESVLDHKRATAISVAMKRMRLTSAKFGKLAWALRDMNESYLTPTAVEILSKSQVWATPKEIEDMKARVRDGYELADPDALLWFLATSVPDMSTRVAALAFRYEFDEVLGELIRATSLIKAASLEICTSELLKRLFRVVLLIGNNINESLGGTAAWGIEITSLSKLTTTKTADKSLSVLDCIVAYLDQMAPETFEVVDDCTCTPSAAKYSIANESQVLKNARRGLETMRKIKAMEKFCLSASKKLDDIERELKQARESFDKCLDHFCMPRGSMDTDQFFGILNEFFDSFEKAIAAFEVRQRQLLNPGPQVRSGLFNPTFMKQRRESSMSFNSTAGGGGLPKKPSIYTARPSIFGRMRPAKD